MLNCAIIDDEPLAREGLAEFIGKLDFLQLKGMCENASQLGMLLDKAPIDLIFLDIRMPGMSGIDYLRLNPDAPMAVMTTAFPEFAVDSFRLNVIDYLLKPITFGRFLEAAHKANEFHSFRKKSTAISDHFFVKCANVYEKIIYGDILYMESLQNYVMIYTRKDKYMSLMNLKALEAHLDGDAFMRVHKSYMVALDKIDALETDGIRIGKQKIPVSRSYRDVVLSKVIGARLIR